MSQNKNCGLPLKNTYAPYIIVIFQLPVRIPRTDMQHQYLKRLFMGILLVCVLALSILYSANYSRVNIHVKKHMVRLVDTLQNSNRTVAGGRGNSEDGDAVDELFGSKNEPSG